MYTTNSYPTCQLPMGAHHCPWGVYTDQIVCNMARLALLCRSILRAAVFQQKRYSNKHPTSFFDQAQTHGQDNLARQPSSDNKKQCHVLASYRSSFCLMPAACHAHVLFFLLSIPAACKTENNCVNFFLDISL